MNTKTGLLTKARAHFVSMGIPTDCWKTRMICNNKYIVGKEFQHLFNFNFGVLVRGIGVVFNKVLFLMTDHYS
jgi:hypothetical protein